MNWDWTACILPSQEYIHLTLRGVLVQVSPSLPSWGLPCHADSFNTQTAREQPSVRCQECSKDNLDLQTRGINLDFACCWWAPWLLVPKLWNGMPEMLGGSECPLQRSARFPVAQDRASSLSLSALLPAWSTASWEPRRSSLPWARGAQLMLSLEAPGYTCWLEP